ncbi:urease subunit gamma [Natronobeatus ordinarius]|uniref:urease subunit gamma n=1 Tax=Natronobeatus ordinarius TaxID=2963433 RepID=UPI0020CED6B8|nr:urease subunit gamma [Natronobeatus ordinarius]
MNLTPKERERLTIFMAAELARRRKERGVKLNHPESVAYIADWVCEGAREGTSVSQLREEATRLLTREDVMDGVPELVDMVQVEPVFPDGTKLVTVHDPIRADSREQLEDALEEPPTRPGTTADADEVTD